MKKEIEGHNIFHYLKKLSKDLRKSNETMTDGDLAADTLDEIIKGFKDKNEGALPNICPKCKKSELEWGEKEFNESMSQTATCPKCKTEFIEIHHADHWEEIKNESNN